MIKLIPSSKTLVCLLTLLLSGCSSAPNYSVTDKATLQANAQQQASKFLQLAKRSQEPQEQNEFKLMATEQLITANQLEQAEQILNTIPNQKLVTDMAAYKRILLAQLYLAKQQTNKAQQELAAIWTPGKLPESMRIKFYTTRAEIYRRSGSIVESVKERIYLGKNLHSPAELKANNQIIWEMLSELTPNTLQNLQRNSSRDELNGWVAFTSITKQYDPNPEYMMKALAVWKENYPNHPAAVFISESLEQPVYASSFDNSPEEYTKPLRKSLNKPQQIALLLPLTGTNASSAQAVRDGFMAASQATNNPNKPQVKIYDTNSAESIQTVYQQAIDNGADFVVGPLIKEDVDSISSYSKPKVPVLALNMLLTRRVQENIFQFGLSPEMEAQAVAEKAWSDGHRNALIIIPKSAWGKRMQTAFQDYWQAMGGAIIGVQEVQSQANLNQEVQHLLSIDQSEARAKQLESLGLKFNFEPRRRQDPDMIFIATNAALARQVKPLLNFYYAGKLPAYASSSIFTGKAQPTLDQDLNGIKFCDMPGILNNSSQLASANNQETEQYARLYALGLDAYKIALNIDQLSMLPDLGISGMTGMLTLDAQNKIQRKLVWAKFKNGVPDSAN